jgi:ABC-type multidrug transport system permease subunit
MWATFKYTLKALVREKSILIWVIIFPIVLATMFLFIAGFDAADLTIDPIAVAIVDDANYREATQFKDMIDDLAKTGDDQILDVTLVATSKDAEQKLWDKEIAGFITVGRDAKPKLSFSSQASLTSIERYVLKDIIDRYVRTQKTFGSIAMTNPRALADPALLQALAKDATLTKEVSITANKVTISGRYYYALLGFLAIMAANTALVAIVRTQPNLSALGARRAVGGTSRFTTLAATFMASWVLSYVCLLNGFLYVRFILKVDFGGKELACLVAFIFAAFMATSLGTLVGLIPRLAEQVKTGMLTIISSFFSLFAGLYGEPSMQLADKIARTAPWAQKLNPVRQVTDLFYSLYYYDTYTRFFEGLVTLSIMTVVFFVFAMVLVRRQRYASL